MNGGINYSDLSKMPISDIIYTYRKLVEIKKKEADDIESAKNNSRR